MVGYSFEEYYRCTTCEEYFLKEKCPMHKSSQSDRVWPICPNGCSKHALRTTGKNKTWKKYQKEHNPSKEPGKMLRQIAIKKQQQQNQN